MRVRSQVALYSATLCGIALTAILIAIRDQLVKFGPWVLGLLIVLVACVVLYLLFVLYLKAKGQYLTMQSQSLKVQEQRHIVAGIQQSNTIELERAKVEILERKTTIYIARTRVQADGGLYLVHPEALPSQQDVLFLPAQQKQIALPQRADSLQDEQQARESERGSLPTNVPYEEVRHLVPRGHVLVGIGYDGIETKESAVGACLWILGLSGTGKTSTTALRIEERSHDGHMFIGGDPHWFKDDSLFHAVYETLDGQPGPYAQKFVMPMAKTDEELNEVLKAFVREFKARKEGKRRKPFQKITLLVDEVTSITDLTTDEDDEIRKENAGLLKHIARVCGQEARNFGMGGIFISQQATGLAWLAKVALMIIVHQLLREAEKKLATNNDTEVMKDMKTWPIGRTYVYGVGFGQEGPRTVQQPRFTPQPVTSYEELESLPSLEDLPRVFQAQQSEELNSDSEANAEATGRSQETDPELQGFVLRKFLAEARKMRENGDSIDAILKHFGLPPGGYKNQIVKALLEDAQIVEG